MFSKNQIKNKDYLEFLDNLSPSELDTQFDNLPYFKRQQQLNEINKNIMLIKNIIGEVKKNDLYEINISTEVYIETRKYLRQKVLKEIKIIEFLKFLVHLTIIDNNFIQCGSNSLNLLVEMNVDLTKQCFSNIKIKNSSLIGANFVHCILSESELDNVIINGINLNCAKLFNCKLKNLQINELFQLEGHSQGVMSVCFSPDGTTLASGSYDNSIRLWDVKTGQQKAQLDGHTRSVRSVYFSPDGTTLASGSEDNSVRLWDVKTRQYKAQLDGHSQQVWSVCFSPDETTLASGSYDNSIHIWELKNGNEIQPYDAKYTDILAQFKTNRFLKNTIQENSNTNITFLRISQKPLFQSKGALILNGQFENQSGIDLKILFKQRGSCILDQ